MPSSGELFSDLREGLLKQRTLAPVRRLQLSLAEDCFRHQLLISSPSAPTLQANGVGEKLKRPPVMSGGPPGSKLLDFEKCPVRPGYRRFALAIRGRESKLLFHRRNKKIVAVRTHNSGFHTVANGHARIGLLPASAC